MVAQPQAQRRTRTCRTATLAFVAMAAVDACEPTILVSGAWWLVLLCVWAMPWPVTDDRREREPWLTQLAALTVLAWLYFRATDAINDAVRTWEIFDPHNAWYQFTYLLQDTVTGLTLALLLAAPLLRIFRRESVAAAFLVATPTIAITCAGTAFDPARWLREPGSSFLWLFEAVFPALLVMYACERRLRSSRSRPALGLTRAPALALLVSGEIGGRRAALALALAFALVVIVLRAEMELPEPVIAALPALGSIWEIAFTAATLLLTVTFVVAIRAMRGQELKLGPLKIYGTGSEWTLAALLVAPFWLLTIFHAAPVIGASSIDTLQRLPAPVWHIAYDDRERTVALDGAYGQGVAAELDRFLAAHPDAVAVELSGPGGLVDEGMAIAERIERRGLSTVVTNDCSSACTHAFAGGKERILVRDGSLGFHASRHPSVLLEWLKDTTVEDAFLRRRGISAEFIARANAVPHDDIWYPTRDELLAAGVITAVESPRSTAMASEPR